MAEQKAVGVPIPNIVLTCEHGGGHVHIILNEHQAIYLCAYCFGHVVDAIISNVITEGLKLGAAHAVREGWIGRQR